VAKWPPRRPEERGQEWLSDVGREFHRTREYLHLTDEQKANALSKLTVDSSTLPGRKVVSVARTDGAKFVYEDGSWMLLRLSGTEPLLRLYVEAESEAATRILVHDASEWILKVG
jgi:phosphoglucomutase